MIRQEAFSDGKISDDLGVFEDMMSLNLVLSADVRGWDSRVEFTMTGMVSVETLQSPRVNKVVEQSTGYFSIYPKINYF